MFRRYLLAGILGLSASVSHAAFSYTFVEGGIGEVDEGDALFLKGSQSVNQNIFVLGAVHMVDPDIAIAGYDGEGFYVQGGLGYAMPMAPEVDVFATAELLYANFDLPGEDDDIGHIARVGIRYMAVDRIELEGSATHSSNDFLVDDGLGVTGAARYYMTREFSAAIGYSQDTELDGAFFSVRYDLR